MSATRRLPTITALLGVATLSVTAISKPALRERIAGTLGVNVPGGVWRILAISLALLNLKNWPFVWHVRLFRALIYHLFIQRTTLPPSALFAPIITPSHTPITETDYNFHKSNSTYFTDLDIARTHLVTALLKQGIKGVGTRPEEKGKTAFSFRNTSRAAGGYKRRKSSFAKGKDVVVSALGASGKESGNGERPPMTEEEWFAKATEPGNLLIALGAVSCQFHREIPPYKHFEIWTRLLTWDRKWLYIVSHFVEAGTFVPEKYALQPWKKPKVGGKWEELNEKERMGLKRKIYASSIAKYVVKKGRLTVPPEMVLERSHMLPPRSEGTKVLGGWQSNGLMKEYGASGTSSSSEESEGESKDKVIEESLFPSTEQGGDWTWEMVQEERLKGLKFAEAYDSLDGLKDIFGGGGGEVMGQYSDLVFGW